MRGQRQGATEQPEISLDSSEIEHWRCGLREPKDELERLEVLFRQQKISEQDFTAQLQVFAERRADAALSTGRLSG